MATALSVIRPEVAKKMQGYISGTTTSAGATDGSTFVCTSLKEYSDGKLQNRWALIAGVKRKIDTNFQSNGTVRVLVPFSSQVANSTEFEIYSIDPDEIKDEINRQLKGVFPLLCQVVADETVETVASTYEYSKPTMQGDAYQIFLEAAVTTNPWIKLLNWDYDIYEDKIRFPYALPAGRNLRIIGVDYLSTVDDDDDDTEIDEPQTQILYARVVAELYRQLAAGEVGTDGDKYQKQVSRWENTIEELEDTHRMVLPARTLKISGWLL